MAHYLIAHLNGGRYGDVQILSSAGIDELHRGVAEQRVMGTSVAAYGMGWFVNKIGQTKLVSHGGNVPDFSSYHGAPAGAEEGRRPALQCRPLWIALRPDEVGMGVAALLAGQQPRPIRLGFIPWVMRALLLIPLLQIAGVVATLRLLRRWRQDPAARPSRGRMWGQHILLPLIPNLSLLAILAYLRSSGLLRYHAPLHARLCLDRPDQRRLRRDMGLPAHRVGPRSTGKVVICTTFRGSAQQHTRSHQATRP